MNVVAKAIPISTKIDWSIDIISDLISEDPSINSGIRIIGFNPDDYNDDDDIDPWVAAGQAEEIAKRVDIHLSRHKELTLLAVIDEQRLYHTVVGAVWSSFDRDTEYDQQDVYVYDFDVVSDPRYRSAGRIGLHLIEAALEHYKDLSRDVPQSYIRVYVVNRKLIPYLERKYGFEIESQYSHGAAHMVYYG